MTLLDNYVCENTACCLIGQNNKVYTAQGKAKGAKTNYRLENKSSLYINKYIIDDCVLRQLSVESKCDFLFLVKRSGGEQDGYFVEMKGSDINQACEQISTSIKQLSGNITGGTFARIVSTRIATPNYNQRKAYKDLKKQLGKNFIHSNKFLEDIV